MCNRLELIRPYSQISNKAKKSDSQQILFFCGLLFMMGVWSGFLHPLMAQNFAVGHTTVVFHDSARNRDVATQIYYPATIAGIDVPIASGNFPVIIFGHGFLMGWEAYENMWTHMVPHGYVMAFPTTEMSLSPNHQEFATDLRFLVNKMQQEAQNDTAIFYNSLATETALMGHSMGGGAAVLAAANNTQIHTLVNFAAAETTPSAIAAAVHVTVPTLMFSGQEDCVAPPASHQYLILENLGAYCSVLLDIKEGGHCYFANDNAACNLGESFCNSGLNISRAEQQEITQNSLLPWIDYTLKGDQNAWDTFKDTVQYSTRFVYQQMCWPMQVETSPTQEVFTAYPNPVKEQLNVKIGGIAQPRTLTIYNMFGQVMYTQIITQKETSISTANWPYGTYMIQVANATQTHYQKLVKSK